MDGNFTAQLVCMLQTAACFTDEKNRAGHAARFIKRCLKIYGTKKVIARSQTQLKCSKVMPFTTTEERKL